MTFNNLFALLFQFFTISAFGDSLSTDLGAGETWARHMDVKHAVVLDLGIVGAPCQFAVSVSMNRDVPNLTRLGVLGRGNIAILECRPLFNTDVETIRALFAILLFEDEMRSRGAKVVIMSQHRYRDAENRPYRMYDTIPLLLHPSTTYIDLDAIWAARGLHHDESLYVEDGVHLSAEGAGIQADIVEARLPLRGRRMRGRGR